MTKRRRPAKRQHAHAEDDFTAYPKDQTSGLSLFEQQPIEPPAPAEATPSIDEQFRAFHRANPHVYAEIERRALALHRVGKARIGMKAIVEAMRFDWMLTTRSDDFKLNNSHVSRYARLLIDQHPELEGVIEMRELRSA